jgi:hypothetical protein
MPKPSGWHRKRRDTPAERARTARYAGAEHREASRAFAAVVDAGRGYCWRCGGWINPRLKDAAGKRAWHVGHRGSVIAGPEHNTCNLSAGAVDGARKRNGGPSGSTRVRL